MREFLGKHKMIFLVALGADAAAAELNGKLTNLSTPVLEKG
jgi:hypothetical protein